MPAVAVFEPLPAYYGKARARRIAGALPVVTAEMANLAPLWFGSRLPHRVNTLFGPCKLQQGALMAVPAGEHLCAEGRIGKAEFSVSFPKEALPRLLSEAGIQYEDPEIDPFVQALVLEHLFGPMIGALETATGLEVALDRVNAVAAGSVAGLPVQLSHVSGRPITAFLKIALTDLQSLLPGPRNTPIATIAAASRLPVSLCAGAMWVTMDDLMEWKTGDVIVLSPSKEHPDAFLCIAGGAVAQVRVTTDSLVLLTPFKRPLSPNRERISPMAKENPAAQQVSLRSLSDVALMVSFELGQRTMTLAELGDLAVGSVFEIGSLVDNQARIRVNGTLVGAARLVQIEDRLGVQIVSLQPIDA